MKLKLKYYQVLLFQNCQDLPVVYLENNGFICQSEKHNSSDITMSTLTLRELPEQKRIINVMVYSLCAICFNVRYNMLSWSRHICRAIQSNSFKMVLKKWCWDENTCIAFQQCIAYMRTYSTLLFQEGLFFIVNNSQLIKTI